MMYGNKLAAAIRVSGKVLREVGDIVYLPFGSEYEIYLKNLNTVRALVTVSIDGRDVTDGKTQFVIDPNDGYSIERFLPNGNSEAGNRFRFIERTAGIEEHRGVGIDDGLVRIEYRFERPYISPKKPMWKASGYDDGIMRSRRISASLSSMSASAATTHNVSAQNYYHVDLNSFVPQSMNDAGITAEGSVSEQKFQTIGSFPVESTSHSLVIRLLGEQAGQVVQKPYFVKTKTVCGNCGKTNVSAAKFCPACGTGLSVVA